MQIKSPRHDNINNVLKRRGVLNKIHNIRNAMKHDIDFDDAEGFNNHLKELKELVNSIQEA